MIAAAGISAWRDTGREMSLWLLAAATGVALWTLAEYAIHRFVLHEIAPFSAMHDEHHEAPRALLGTPTWASLAVFVSVVFLPTWALASFNVASGLTAGVMAGFVWYGVVHHAIHHRKPRVIARRLLMSSR